MTAQDWLTSKVNFEISDLSVESILIDRDLALDDDATIMTEKQRDLTRADACIIFLLSSNKGGSTKVDGNSTLKTSSENFTYRNEVQAMAEFWYDKWGETVATTNVIKDKTSMW